MTESEYLTLKNQIKSKQKHMQKLLKEVSDLFKQCPHHEIEPKEQYFEGGYDYTAYTEKWNECKLCHKKSNITTIEHGRYG